MHCNIKIFKRYLKGLSTITVNLLIDHMSRLLDTFLP